MRQDARVAVDLGAILRAIGAIGATDRNQPLPLQAEAVIAVVVDAANRAILRHRLRTTHDRGQAAERPSHAEQAIATLAAVVQRQRWRHARRSRRHRDRDAVGRSPRRTDSELAR